MVSPLPLDSPDWTELTDAYGSAADIPDLLAEVADPTATSDTEELWGLLGSALTHQGDVYPASFAAVPHIVDAALRNSASTDVRPHLGFAAWVEICRRRTDTRIPAFLAPAYFEALSALPRVVATASDAEWDREMLLCAMAALAVGKGHVEIGEVIMELSDTPEAEVVEWLLSR